jgi:histidinol phosphatase-like PHP family hydrolase/energy-coupling factor transporter ATP-binding protein EcfA2
MAIGAKFLRADLHIHSYGEFGSYDVTDVTMTPQAIVDTAIEKDLGLISITDHNEILNSNTAITHAQGKNIFVIPGIEVSTTQGHLLLYFPEFNDLRNFHGKLTISPDKKTCQNGIVQCLDFAQQCNGLGVLAHIELDSGFEKTIGRFGPPMEEIFKHRNLLGLEICTKENNILYTDLDDNPNRKRLIGLHREACEYNEPYNIAKLLSSDAHDLNKLGINAEGGKKLTRIKIDELNFHSFKIALISNESRIRLEDFISEQRPVIKSINIEGGLLDKVKIDLSTNLTCIIGGRGTGKSTLLEAIRESAGNKSNAKVVDSDAWPQKISLKYEDEAGQVLEFNREKFADTQNVTDPINGISRIDVESYGQGDTAETLQHCDTNPMILVKFLDSFLDLDSLKNQDNEVVAKLRENQSESRKLRLGLLSLPDTKKSLLNEQKKLTNLEKEKAGELVEYQTALIKERHLHKGLIDDLNTLVKTYRDIFKNDAAFVNFNELSDAEIVVGNSYFKKSKRNCF